MFPFIQETISVFSLLVCLLASWKKAERGQQPSPLFSFEQNHQLVEDLDQLHYDDFDDDTLSRPIPHIWNVVNPLTRQLSLATDNSTRSLN